MTVKNRPAESEEILNRAMIRANRAMFTIQMQVRRIGDSEPEDVSFLGRQMADFEFLVVAASRLRRAGNLAKKAQETSGKIANALAAFDNAIPELKKFRDIAEHIDEYSVDDGWDKSIERQHLENFAVTNGGKTFTWLDCSINVDELADASLALYLSVKNAKEQVEAG